MQNWVFVFFFCECFGTFFWFYDDISWDILVYPPGKKTVLLIHLVNFFTLSIRVPRNCPYQLTRLPKVKDLRKSAILFCIFFGANQPFLYICILFVWRFLAKKKLWNNPQVQQMFRDFSPCWDSADPFPKAPAGQSQRLFEAQHSAATVSER